VWLKLQSLRFFLFHETNLMYLYSSDFSESWSWGEDTEAIVLKHMSAHPKQLGTHVRRPHSFNWSEHCRRETMSLRHPGPCNRPRTHLIVFHRQGSFSEVPTPWSRGDAREPIRWIRLRLSMFYYKYSNVVSKFQNFYEQLWELCRSNVFATALRCLLESRKDRPNHLLRLVV
jgi:hypothetical protein